mgnify:CR=1 FL=1
MITKDQIYIAQKNWGDGIVKIGTLMNDESACFKFTSSFLNNIYDFKNSEVLFKPTKCAVEQFRPSKAEAKSYFIAGDDRACNEDKGFAINPWTKVRFENSGMILEQNRAIAMGNYFFTDLDGNEAKVEYTFGYMLDDQGSLRINLKSMY